MSPPIPEFPVDKWDAIIAINMSSGFPHHGGARADDAARPAGGGSSTSPSAHGLRASESNPVIAAKHGVVGLTKVTALETARDAITATPSAPAMC